MPDISTVNIHNGFFRNAELEHLKQLNTDLYESWKCTVLIKCIFDILASRETHFLCSFTSLLYFHLRFNYLPSSHLRMCRLPFTIHQALCVGGTNPFIQKKKMWTSHFDCIVWASDKAKRMLTVFQEYQCPWNEICCLVYWSTSSLSWDCQCRKESHAEKNWSFFPSKIIGRWNWEGLYKTI